ncbi:MAG: MoxR family ATPase [Lachnospiraceae bacterium]|nr:MoxR family ATPase [Lachnospiraceae bacterium]
MVAETATVQKQGEKLIANIGKVIVGKDETAKLLLTALLAGGHVLLEDVPGSGKTKLARSLAASLQAEFARIQFTPDLLPSDVTGMNIYNRKTDEFELHKGPAFTNILLADEINRATPRTQAGLLECMEEKQVTIDGVSYQLPEPFFVIATQNPVENAGTFPLPEAQLDRFIMKLSMGLPSQEEEQQILRRFGKEDPLKTLTPAITTEEFSQMKKKAETVFVHEAIEEYLVKIAAATRNNDKIIMGVSTRGTLALLHCAKAYAALEGREYCIPDDIRKLAVPVLAHRLVISYGYQQGKEAENLIAEILKKTEVPTEDFSQIR